MIVLHRLYLCGVYGPQQRIENANCTTYGFTNRDYHAVRFTNVVLHLSALDFLRGDSKITCTGSSQLIGTDFIASLFFLGTAACADFMALGFAIRLPAIPPPLNRACECFYTCRTFSPSRCRSKASRSRGFVNMSATLVSVEVYVIRMACEATTSRMK
ncbi:hypothetical protein DFS34DRAFT_213978 [Phlyctochytrium arcticum]|nr:hypothetical protein DFS34DRAFT_213978 [Phlyctochytrium arcticum]